MSSDPSRVCPFFPGEASHSDRKTQQKYMIFELRKRTQANTAIHPGQHQSVSSSTIISKSLLATLMHDKQKHSPHHFSPAQIPLFPWPRTQMRRRLLNLQLRDWFWTLFDTFIQANARDRSRVGDIVERHCQLQVRHFEWTDTERACHSMIGMNFQDFASFQIWTVIIALFGWPGPHL